MTTRELTAYALIVTLIIGAIVWFAMTGPRRQAEKLRRRGVKSYNEDH